MLDAKAREALSGIQLKAGALIGRSGLSANALTVIGVGVTGAAAWQITERAWLAAGILVLASGLVDVLDGAVAKATGTMSTWGGFLDSVADRISDALVLGALAWAFHAEGHDVGFVLALVSLAAAEVTSYVRAKAESLGFTCRVGVIERAERFVLLVVGLLLGILVPVLWVLAVLSTVTVLQRVVHVRGQARAL